MRNRLVRSALLLLAMVLGATVLPGTADAGWTRSFSSLDTFSEDVQVCTDVITIETLYRVNMEWDDATYPQSLGMAYPFGDDTLNFFATEADAANNVNPIATMITPLFQTEIGTNTPFNPAEFEGTQTIATPAGYSDGDVLWVRSLDLGVFGGFGLTVGDAIYGCPPADADGDGVADIDDLCADTVLPDEPTRGLKKNRYAASIDGFASTNGGRGCHS